MSITRRFGVLGRSLAHSQSPALFADRFSAWGINDASYERFERANLEGFGKWLQTEAEASPALVGLNVTIPYKQSIIPLLQDLTRTARAIGAVNAIKPGANGWVGHNTDAEGFMKSLRPFLTSAHDRALILATEAPRRPFGLGCNPWASTSSTSRARRLNGKRCGTTP